MSKNIQLFLASLLAAFAFFLAANLIQSTSKNFFLAKELEKNRPVFFIAQIAQSQTQDLRSQNCQIAAESAVAVEINEAGREKMLFEKGKPQKMYIASLTKLMTATVAVEFYHSTERVEISKAAVRQEETAGNLEVGEILPVKDLLTIMLIESSNDAAYALTQPTGVKGFVNLMNLKAEEMGLDNTYFYNPTGLEPDEPNGEINYSSGQDLVKIAKYLLFNHPSVLEPLNKKGYDLYFDNGVLHHTLLSTNELLGEVEGIIAGKTGWTEEAGGCLLLILEGKTPGTYLVNVVLNSPDRFEDMRTLINCYN